MIAWLKGALRDVITPGQFILDVQGVGYLIETSLQTFFQVEHRREPFELYVYTVIREDAMQLFGFLEKQEKTLFMALIKVNGVGPKSAIAILSSIKPNEFIQCIQQQRLTELVKLPGIGKKTAERLIVEMQYMLDKLDIAASDANLTTLNPEVEAAHALEALGYKRQEAVSALKKIDKALFPLSCEQLIRHALQILAKR